MSKAIIYLLLIVWIVTLASAQNHIFIYNPYTSYLDATLDNNQSGWNITADYLFGDGTYITNLYTNETVRVDALELANVSTNLRITNLNNTLQTDYYTIVKIELMNSTLSVDILDVNNTLHTEYYNINEIELMNSSLLSDINDVDLRVTDVNTTLNLRITNLNGTLHTEYYNISEIELMNLTLFLKFDDYYTITQIESMNTTLNSDINSLGLRITDVNDTFLAENTSVYSNLSSINSDVLANFNWLTNLEANFTAENISIYSNLSIINTDVSNNENWISNLENNFTNQNTTNYNEFVPYTGAIENVNLNYYNLTNISYLGIGINVEPDHNLDVVGDMLLTHVATSTDEHGIEIKMDAKGIGDVKGLDIIYTTGAIETGEDEEVILINIDEFDAVGGHVVGVEVISTDGLADVYGLEAGALVNPLLQLSGVFMDMDSVNVSGVDYRAEFISVLSNVEFFTADDDYVTIGHSTHFEELEFILNVSASKNVKPVFEFSTGVGSWQVFTPADGTNGFENNGVIIWDRADVPAWQVGVGGEYLIRITRTRNNIQVAPIENFVQVSDVVEYIWNKDGDIRVRRVNATNFSGSLDCSNLIGNTSDLCSLVDTTIADTDTNLTEADVESYIFDDGIHCGNLTGNTSDLCTLTDTDTNCTDNNSCPLIVYEDELNYTIDTDTDSNLTGTDIVSHVGNWSSVKSDYYNITEVEVMNSSLRTDLADTNETDRVDDLESANVSTNVRVDDLNTTKLDADDQRYNDTLVDTNETDNVDAILAGNNTWIAWANISSGSFPAACPSDSYLTQLGTSVTCTELIDTDTNLSESDVEQYIFNDGIHCGNLTGNTSDLCTLTDTTIPDTDTNLTETDVMTYVNGSNVNLTSLFVGSGAFEHPLDYDGDVYVTDKLEVDGQSYFGDSITLELGGYVKDTKPLYFGSSGDSHLMWNTYQTNDALHIATDGSSRSILVMEKDDHGTNFGHANQDDPTIFIQSSDATNVSQYLSLTHNQSSAVIDSGWGGISFANNNLSGIDLINGFDLSTIDTDTNTNCSTSGGCAAVYQGTDLVLDESGADYHNMTGMPTCSGTDKLTFDGTDLSCDTDVGGNPKAGADYLYNDSTSIYWNDTRGNNTYITYDNQSNLDVNSSLTSYDLENYNTTTLAKDSDGYLTVVLSWLEGLFIKDTDSFGGDVSGTYDNLLVNQEFNNTDANCSVDGSCSNMCYLDYPNFGLINLSNGVYSNTDIYLGQGSGTTDDSLFFDQSNERIYWDNIPGEFVVSDDLKVDGGLSVTGDLNVIGDLSVDGQSMFSAYRSTAQSIGNSNYTDIVYSTELYDNLGEYSTTTGIFTATKAGYYAASWGFLFTNTAWTADNAVISALVKNNIQAAGTRWFGLRTQLAVDDTAYLGSVGSAQVYLAATDTLRIKGFQNSGGAVNIHNDASFNYFMVHKFS